MKKHTLLLLTIALFIFNLPTLNAQIKSEEKIEKMIKQKL